MLKRFISSLILISFTISSVCPSAFGQMVTLPQPGTMLNPTSAVMPVIMRGVNIDPNNPLKFDFIMDKGTDKTGAANVSFEAESKKLINYFLASLTVPQEEMWVNLSPNEPDRIIPANFGKTEMGRDVLAQDYLLKQLTSSLMYPENELGKKFWAKIYERAQKEFGTTDIPTDTYNKVWIIPETAKIYEHANGSTGSPRGGAFIVKTHLKVMMEKDYVKEDRSQELPARPRDISSSVVNGKENVVSATQEQIFKQIIIPEIEKEVNDGAIFANLRQIYNSMLLALWYKKALKDSLLGKAFVDQKKTSGLELTDKNANQKIYEQYLAAFKKGVYDYVKEEYDPKEQKVISRKYFSGGWAGDKTRLAVEQGSSAELNEAVQVLEREQRTIRVSGQVSPDGAMLRSGQLPLSALASPNIKSYEERLKIEATNTARIEADTLLFMVRRYFDIGSQNLPEFINEAAQKIYLSGVYIDRDQKVVGSVYTPVNGKTIVKGIISPWLYTKESFKTGIIVGSKGNRVDSPKEVMIVGPEKFMFTIRKGQDGPFKFFMGMDNGEFRMQARTTTGETLIVSPEIVRVPNSLSEYFKGRHFRFKPEFMTFTDISYGVKIIRNINGFLQEVSSLKSTDGTILKLRTLLEGNAVACALAVIDGKVNVIYYDFDNTTFKGIQQYIGVNDFGHRIVFSLDEETGVVTASSQKAELNVGDKIEFKGIKDSAMNVSEAISMAKGLVGIREKIYPNFLMMQPLFDGKAIAGEIITTADQTRYILILTQDISNGISVYLVPEKDFPGDWKKTTSDLETWELRDISFAKPYFKGSFLIKEGKLDYKGDRKLPWLKGEVDDFLSKIQSSRAWDDVRILKAYLNQNGKSKSVADWAKQKMADAQALKEYLLRDVPDSKDLSYVVIKYGNVGFLRAVYLTENSKVSGAEYVFYEKQDNGEPAIYVEKTFMHNTFSQTTEWKITADDIKIPRFKGYVASTKNRLVEKASLGDIIIAVSDVENPKQKQTKEIPVWEFLVKNGFADQVAGDKNLIRLRANIAENTLKAKIEEKIFKPSDDTTGNALDLFTFGIVGDWQKVRDNIWTAVEKIQAEERFLDTGIIEAGAIYRGKLDFDVFSDGSVQIANARKTVLQKGNLALTDKPRVYLHFSPPWEYLNAEVLKRIFLSANNVSLFYQNVKEKFSQLYVDNPWLNDVGIPVGFVRDLKDGRNYLAFIPYKENPEEYVASPLSNVITMLCVPITDGNNPNLAPISYTVDQEGIVYKTEVEAFKNKVPKKGFKPAPDMQFIWDVEAGVTVKQTDFMKEFGKPRGLEIYQWLIDQKFVNEKGQLIVSIDIIKKELEAAKHTVNSKKQEAESGKKKEELKPHKYFPISTQILDLINAASASSAQKLFGFEPYDAASPAADKAALVEAVPQVAQRDGGIDLNAANIKMDVDQAMQGGFKMNIDPAMLQQIQNAKGLQFNIMQVQPNVSLRLLLGLLDVNDVKKG
ncbi:MAG: hypothetical protein HQL25_05310 [Candidatus Omnitrophica bacterium]|nr:hypothetical protein [Candidatus Omnitrophota bacterium]